MANSFGSSSRNITLSVDESAQINEKSILCAGWVTKQGHFRKNWKERYFVLASEGEGIKKRCSIFYFKEKWVPGDVQLPLGAFPLHGASISCTQPPSDRPQPWYTFSVWTCFDHCYPLRCRSERERDLWMSQIGAAIRNEEAPDLDRSDASVLDGTKLDYYQVPEKSNVESSSGVPTRRVSSNGSQAAQEVSNTKRRNLPRVDNDREHTSSQVQSAIKTESAGGVPIIVPAMASVEKPSENAKRIKAQIQYEKARRAKIQVLDEWLCNADLGHLRQKIKAYGVESLEDLTDSTMLGDKKILQECFDLEDGAWEIDRLAHLQEMVLEVTKGHEDNNVNKKELKAKEDEKHEFLEDQMVKKALYISSLDQAEESYQFAIQNNNQNTSNNQSSKQTFTKARFMFEKALAIGLELNKMNDESVIPENKLNSIQERIHACKKREDEVFLNKSMPTKKSKARIRKVRGSDSSGSDGDDDNDDNDDGVGRNDGVKGLARPNSFLNKKPSTTSMSSSEKKTSAASVMFPVLSHEEGGAAEDVSHVTESMNKTNIKEGGRSQSSTANNIVFL